MGRAIGFGAFFLLIDLIAYAFLIAVEYVVSGASPLAVLHHVMLYSAWRFLFAQAYFEFLLLVVIYFLRRHSRILFVGLASLGAFLLTVLRLLALSGSTSQLAASFDYTIFVAGLELLLSAILTWLFIFRFTSFWKFFEPRAVGRAHDAPDAI